MRRTTLTTLLPIAALLLTTPAAASDAPQAGKTPAAETKPEAPAEPERPKPEGPTATLHTTKGRITLAFLPDLAPNHVENFLDLARSGFYDGTRFHRVISGYMIQGGDPNSKDDDPTNDGLGNGPRLLEAEFSSRSHQRGILSMARRSGQPNSASCQFFIVQRAAPQLDGQYTVFGYVVDGMDVVDAIASVPRTRDGRDRPLQDVVIKRVEVKGP